MTLPKPCAAPARGSARTQEQTRLQNDLVTRRAELEEARAACRREQLAAELACVHGLERPIYDLRRFEHRVQLAHLLVLKLELELTLLGPSRG